MGEDSAPTFELHSYASLELADIGKSFSSTKVLEHISFSLSGGQCVMLVGENGAGKSTLKNIISGLVVPDTGTIAMAGRMIKLRSQRDAQSFGIATIHQELSLFANLTVAENIFLGHQTKGAAPVPWRNWRRHAQAIVEEQLGADIDVDAKVEDLSIGQRQLVEIAKALSVAAKVLVLDEPTTCLTLPERDRLMNLVRSLRSRGIAILYITHFMDEVYALADRIVVLRDGVVVGNGTPRNISRSRLGWLMAGREVAETIRTLPVVAPDARSRLRVEALSDGAIVDDVGLHVRAGEILGLAGLVGSGRSEIAETLVGLRARQEGKVWLNGVEISPRSPAEALALGIVLVSEDRRLDQAFLERSITENMTAPILRRLTGAAGLMQTRRERVMVHDITERYQVSHPGARAPMSALSGGNQQKLIIGRWLGAQPIFCILDEPTKGVDIGAREAIHRLIVELVGQGLSILLISSDLPELLALSHRLLVLHKGRIVAETTPDATSPAEVIAIASTGQPDFDRTPQGIA